MSLIVGLDIGTRTLTGAVFSGTAKKFRLEKFFVEDVPSVESGTQAEAGGIDAPLGVEEIIEKVVREHGLKAAEFVACVDAKDCIVREITVPFTRDEQIAKTVQFEAEGYFTGFDLEGTVLEYVRVGEGDGKSQLVVLALRHDIVEKRLGLFKRAHIDPVALDLDAAALFNAFARTAAYDPKRTTLLVDMGATSTKILVVEEGELRKIRAVRLEARITAPGRLIPETVAVGSGGPQVSVEVVGDAPPSGFEEFSIEARFQEIERALRRLDPSHVEAVAAIEGSGAEEAADLLGGLDLDDPSSFSPIAVVSDEDFERLSASGNDLDQNNAAAMPDLGAGGTSERAETPFAHRFPGSGLGRESLDYRGYLERLALEIHRSLAGVRLQSPIELICVTGGMSRSDEAKRYLAEELDVETVALDFGVSGEVFETDLDPAEVARVGQLGAVAVGLALKQLHVDRVGIDFRQGPFRYEHRFERLRLPLLVTAALFFLVFLQATFWEFHDWKKEKARLEGYRSLSAATYEAFFDKPVAAGRHPSDAAKGQVEAWQGKGTGEISRYLDVGPVVKDFANVLRESRLTFRLERIELKLELSPVKRQTQPKMQRAGQPSFSAEKTIVEIHVKEPGAYAKLVQLFLSKTSAYFEAKGSERTGKDGWTQINLELTVKPEKLRELEREESS